MSTWNIEMSLTWEEQCSEERVAKLSLVDRIQAALEGKASRVRVRVARLTLAFGICLFVLRTLYPDSLLLRAHSQVITIQVPTIRRRGHNGPDVCCPIDSEECMEEEEEEGEGVGRRSNHGGNPDASATLGVVVAHEGQTPFFYVEVSRAVLSVK